MDNHIPAELANYLSDMGVITVTDTDPEEPTPIRTFEYNLPELDKNGEPPF
jgi:hypothetical protein